MHLLSSQPGPEFQRLTHMRAEHGGTKLSTRLATTSGRSRDASMSPLELGTNQRKLA